MATNPVSITTTPTEPTTPAEQATQGGCGCGADRS